MTLLPRQTFQTILIPVRGDVRDEEPETFFLNLSNPVNAQLSSTNTTQATATIVDDDPARPGELLISEFRASGPGGARDEFVELYNNTDAPIALRNYTLRVQRATSTQTDIFATSNSVIPPRGHLLFAGSAYSLLDYSRRSLIFSNDAFTDNDGIEIRRVAGDVRIDAVGFTDDVSVAREGAGLPLITLPSNVPQYSFVRRGFNHRPQDTDDNAADFVLVSTGAERFGNVQAILGAPGPEDIFSPTSNGFTRQAIILNASKSRLTASPNLSRRMRSSAAGVASGVVTVRRTFTNTTGRALNRLRFRVIEITTLGSPSPTRFADVRVISSSGTQTAGRTVYGLTLEAPSLQPPGGGLNASLRVDGITTETPLAAGATFEVEFQFDVQRAGQFNFAVIAEALP